MCCVLCDEAGSCGKGVDVVVSQLHYYFETDEITCTVHKELELVHKTVYLHVLYWTKQNKTKQKTKNKNKKQKQHHGPSRFLLLAILARLAGLRSVHVMDSYYGMSVTKV